MDVCDFHGCLWLDVIQPRWMSVTSMGICHHVNIPPNIHIILKFVLVISTKQIGSHLPSEPALYVSLFLIHIELSYRGQGDGSVGKDPFHISLMTWLQFLEPTKMEGENLSLKAVFLSWHVCPLPIHPLTHPHTLYTYNHNKKLFFKKRLFTATLSFGFIWKWILCTLKKGPANWVVMLYHVY